MPQLDLGLPASGTVETDAPAGAQGSLPGIRQQGRGRRPGRFLGSANPLSFPSEARIHQPSAGAQLEKWLVPHRLREDWGQERRYAGGDCRTKDPAEDSAQALPQQTSVCLSLQWA